jgi:aspartate ammonia-lyase
MSFEKSTEYIESIYNFMEVLFKKAVALNDNKLKQICKLIFNYLIQCCDENRIY